ncbi:hypothetical protein [Leptothermofonsia sp. ETS-13]|uniref:hypothetical protein n=1 Tax=Leptothermofonsia sp. ETS-13 TaxID=3035696 RepID=UPI003BA351D6
MKTRQYGLIILGIVVVVAIAANPILSPSPSFSQSPPAPSPSPLPPSSPSPPPSPLPSPTSPPQIPPTLTPPPIPPASTAPPLPLNGDYRDPAGRFKVGILAGYKVSPVAGSVLVKSPDGHLAYTVTAQSQPDGNPLGLNPELDSESLARVATTVFQRGEGFQPGPTLLKAGGGIVINWTGSLTVGGRS